MLIQKQEQLTMSTQNNKYYYEPIRRDDTNILYSADEQDAPHPIGYMRLCFSIFYKDGVFLEAIKRVLVDHDIVASGEVYWNYADRFVGYFENNIQPNPHFGEVSFDFGGVGDEIYVSEELSLECAKDACKRFMKLHLEEKYRKFISNILDNWIPFDPETMD